MSVKFSFTITLKPKIFMYPSERQYDDSVAHVKTMLQALKYKPQVTLIAEHTKLGLNIHYHGLIMFQDVPRKNLMKYFIDHFRNHLIIGFVCIKQVTNEDGWNDYITKELLSFRDTTDRNPLIMDDFCLCKGDDFKGLPVGY